MSDLRKHLQTQRDKHREVKYPGDLSSDILAVTEGDALVQATDRSAHRSMSRFKIFGTFGALAAAAMLALVVWIKHEPATNVVATIDQNIPDPTLTDPTLTDPTLTEATLTEPTLDDPTALAIDTEVEAEEPEIAFVLDTPVSMSEGIEDVSIAPAGMGSLVPEYQSMSFPSIPSFSDPGSTDDTTQTTEETAT